METLGKRLMQGRGNSGLTQAAVAEKLNVSSQAVSLWERDETTPDITKLPEIATLYGVTTDWLLKGQEMDEDLPVNDETREAVRLLTKNKNVTRSSEAGLAAYYEEISKNRIAAIVKLLDRCNNISGMATGFTEKRMAQYIQETEKYIYPMMETTSNRFPEYANQIFLIKYHMSSVIEAIRHDMARKLKS